MEQIGKNRSDNNSREIPESLRPFFWDVDFDGLSLRDFSYFIIARLMEHGDEEAMRFLMHAFNRRELGEVLKTSRSISRRSRKFWVLILDMEGESCSAKRYPTPFGDCCWD